MAGDHDGPHGDGETPAKVSLTTPDGKTLATVGDGPAVTVTGEPGKLLMFAADRDQARVMFSGRRRRRPALGATRAVNADRTLYSFLTVC